jgi:protein gp37
MRPAEKRVEKGLWWDKALSLVEGCTPVSDGCAQCWAAKIANARQHHRTVGHRYEGLTNNDGAFNGEIKTFLDRGLVKVAQARKPKVWAVWNDLFHEDVEGSDIKKAIMEIMDGAKQHQFMILTKRPDRMWRWTCGHGLMRENTTDSEEVWPENVWVGTSVENQNVAAARVRDLLGMPGRKFISVEPMLGPVDLENVVIDAARSMNALAGRYHLKRSIRPMSKIDMVICGCESGKKATARPTELEWVRDLRDQCRRNNTPFFLKQIRDDKGRLVKMPELDGQVWAQFPRVVNF